VTQNDNMLREIVENNLIPLDNFIYGTADLNGLIDKKFGEFHFGISIGKRLNDNIIDDIINGPTIEYYNYYNQINIELAKIAENIKVEFKKANIDSIVIEPTFHTNSKRFKKYLQTLTVDISHKMIATRAGLGWIGKTDLFISKDFGPRLRLISLLINRKPEVDSIPIEKSKCGNCKICVERCPPQAANGKLWNIQIHRDEFFDAHRCRKQCELAKKKLNIDGRICGICISVCPIGKKRNKRFKAANNSSKTSGPIEQNETN
jgi:epoxyqueuosine reductase